MSMLKKIGERIRKLRSIRGVTQENVAEELGINTSSYSKIERGETDANTSRLLQIAKVLEVNVTSFFEDRILSAHEDNKYGYASKEEVENLNRVIATLAKQIEKLQEELGKKDKTRKKTTKR
jgi:transcriptional regulator with XRE-family HTH domain